MWIGIISTFIGPMTISNIKYSVSAVKGSIWRVMMSFFLSFYIRIHGLQAELPLENKQVIFKMIFGWLKFLVIQLGLFFFLVKMAITIKKKTSSIMLREPKVCLIRGCQGHYSE